MAASQSLARSALHALCSAYIEEEQAVLIVKLDQSQPPRRTVFELTYLGPFRLNMFPIRLLIIPVSTPVAA
jgi:hypothetical protein